MKKNIIIWNITCFWTVWANMLFFLFSLKIKKNYKILSNIRRKNKPKAKSVLLQDPIQLSIEKLIQSIPILPSAILHIYLISKSGIIFSMGLRYIIYHNCKLFKGFSLSLVWVEFFLPFMILKLCLNKSNSLSLLCFSCCVKANWNFKALIVSSLSCNSFFRFSIWISSSSAFQYKPSPANRLANLIKHIFLLVQTFESFNHSSCSWYEHYKGINKRTIKLLISQLKHPKGIWFDPISPTFGCNLPLLSKLTTIHFPNCISYLFLTQTETKTNTNIWELKLNCSSVWYETFKRKKLENNQKPY